VTVRSSTPPGVYHLFACADNLKKVDELDENNNRRIGATTVTVTSDAGVWLWRRRAPPSPDLVLRIVD